MRSFLPCLLLLLLVPACGPDTFGSGDDGGSTDAAEDRATPDDAGDDVATPDDGGGQTDGPALGFCASNPHAILCDDWDEGNNPGMNWTSLDVSGGALSVVQTNPLSHPSAMEASVSGITQRAALVRKIEVTPSTIGVHVRFPDGGSGAAIDFMRVAGDIGTLTFSVNNAKGVQVSDTTGGSTTLGSADTAWHSIVISCGPASVSVQYDNTAPHSIGVGVTSGVDLSIGIVTNVLVSLGKTVDFDNVLVL